MTSNQTIENDEQARRVAGYRGLFDLQGKVAVVTGGVGVLGQHFCAGLAESGADVAVVDLQVEKAQGSAQILAERYGVRAFGYGCDVSDPTSVREMVAAVLVAHGKIDILHNNAAGKSDDLDAFFAPFEEYSLDQWRKIMSVNLDGMFLVAQAIGKQMVAQGKGGSIIQTASIYGVMAPDNRIYEGSIYEGRTINTPAVYTASKAAVIGLTKHLASYWADKCIRVNTLTPGGTESGQNDEFKNRYSDRIPMRRMANAPEMVGALLYLASDASSYVTGQNIIVDGGLNCW
jgi:NAD(P)-dependent dehydrogenase (short-subunit alcohol dehydrogenase family)